MQIIRAGAEHVELIAPLFDLYRQFYKYKSDLEGALRFLAERLKNGESVAFLALDENGRALGFTQLYPSFSSTTMQRLWILNDLYVIPECRKGGVASALMEQARQLGIETGAAELMLETAVDNFTAQRLYEKLGWQRDKEFYTYHLYLK
jgi:ribosomal protein S18 acetylase RimI-like enzyme